MPVLIVKRYNKSHKSLQQTELKMKSIEVTVRNDEDNHVSLTIEKTGVICRMYQDEHFMATITPFTEKDDLLYEAMKIMRRILDGEDLDKIGIELSGLGVQ